MSQPMSLPWSGLLAEMVAEQTGDDLDAPYHPLDISAWPGEGEGTGYEGDPPPATREGLGTPEVSPYVGLPSRETREAALEIATAELAILSGNLKRTRKAFDRIVTILSEGRE